MIPITSEVRESLRGRCLKKPATNINEIFDYVVASLNDHYVECSCFHEPVIIKRGSACPICGHKEAYVK